MKPTRLPVPEPLRLLGLLCADHGDAFRFSLSKRGRIWLTLTHWDSEKYNTSVELDPLEAIETFWDGLLVLCVSHWLKCFAGGPHADTWFPTDRVVTLVPDCAAQCSLILAGKAGADDDAPSAPEAS